MSENRRGVAQDQVAKGREFFGLRVWRDAAHGHMLNQPAEDVKFRRALLPVQNPVHICVLHQFKKCFAWTDFFNARSALVVAARRKQIDNAEWQLRRREFGASPV